MCLTCGRHHALSNRHAVLLLDPQPQQVQYLPNEEASLPRGQRQISWTSGRYLDLARTGEICRTFNRPGLAPTGSDLVDCPIVADESVKLGVVRLKEAAA